MRRFAVAAIVAMGMCGALAPGALAAGGPPVYLTTSGIAMPGGKGILQTIHPGGQTIVLRIDPKSGRVADYGSLRGAYGIAAIGISAPKPTGLSADGRTLVLSPEGQQRNRTSFAIVDTRGLRLQRIVTFHGTFGLDGVSPDGNSVYLTQYLNPSGTRYAVRRYDVTAGRLDPSPIVDPTEKEQMRGYPSTRVMSPDGRWAYTLYTGAVAGKPPFIHALDMGAGRAKCIDLPRSIAQGVFRDRLHLASDGNTLTVSSKHKGAVATVDTRTFEVSTSASSTTGAPTGSGNDFPWLLLALGGGLIFAVASLWGLPKIHRRRLAGTDR